MLHTPVENGQLHTLKDEELSNWLEVKKSQLEKERLSLVFREVPSRMVEVPQVPLLQAPPSQVIEVDKN